jgi:hypothetical protein
MLLLDQFLSQGSAGQTTTLTLETSLDKCLQNRWPNGRIGMLSTLLMAQDIPLPTY